MVLETELRNARIASSVSATLISLACGTNVSRAAATLAPSSSLVSLARCGSC